MPAVANNLHHDIARVGLDLWGPAPDSLTRTLPGRSLTDRPASSSDGVDLPVWAMAARFFGASAAAGRPDPAGHDKMVATTDPTALFVQGAGDARAIDANDVNQGGMADCYLMAAMANVARNDPGAIGNMIHENRDDAGNVVSYTVDLYARDASGRLVKSPQTVDAREFSQNAARFGDKDVAGNQEIWPRILEKAYAQLKGGHSAIGYGGGANDALEALTGRAATVHPAASYSFNQLEADIQAGKPVCFLTPDTKDADGNVVNDKKEKMLGGQGMYQDHYYYATETRIQDGQQQVRLMNPWGSDHPGADKDGWVPFDEIMKKGMIERVDVGQATSSLTRLLRGLAGQAILRG
jgi:hypothetical protein